MITLTTGTKNGFPFTGTVKLPEESVQYYFQTAGGTTFYTNSGVYQTTDIGFTPTGFTEIACSAITRNGGTAFKPSYGGITLFNQSYLIALIANGAVPQKMVFDWGNITMPDDTEMEDVRTLTSYIVGTRSQDGKTMYVNPARGQIKLGGANGIWIGNELYGTTAAPALTDFTKFTYSYYHEYNDPVKATADTLISFAVNNTTYTAPTPIALTDTTDVKDFIEQCLESEGASLGTVAVNYLQTPVNNNESVLSITISDCNLALGRVVIKIDGTTNENVQVTKLTSHLTVEDGNGYQVFYDFTDPTVATADKLVGLTIDGVAYTLPSAITMIVANKTAIENGLMGLIATAGYAAERVTFNVTPAQANGRKTVMQLIIIGANEVVDSVEIDIDSGTPGTKSFTIL